MTNLIAWAQKHRVSPTAYAELITLLCTFEPPGPADRQGADISEAAVQSRIRLECSRRGWPVWRNNVGAGKLANGRFMRWGIANDSAALNAVFKSADLIGIRPVTVTESDVGRTLGQFYAREVKASGWHYRGTDREKSQKAFIDFVTAHGGDAAFANDAAGV